MGENVANGRYRLMATMMRDKPWIAARVVFTASNPNGDFADAGRKSGCQVLAKPFAVEEFSQAVQTALASPVPSASKS